MLGRIFSIFDSNEKQIKSTEKDLQKIKSFIQEYQDLSFDEIRKKVDSMREELAVVVENVPEDAKISVRKVDRLRGLPKFELDVQNKLYEIMPEFYALVNIVHSRKYGIKYHDVQFRAGIILAKGQRLVEQYTGEGKTQTFMLPLSLYSLVGRGAHLVTVNNYLTKIGAEYAGHTLKELGISVGIVAPEGSFRFIHDEELKTYKGDEAVEARAKQSMKIDAMTGVNLVDCTKRDAYACDITYGTNNEIGFDYLRDNMAWDLNRLAQRELYFCIIDEADSILIDEARTPLIISAAPSDSDSEKYITFANAVKDLAEGAHYVVDHKDKAVSLTEEGIQKVEGNLGVGNLWKDYSMAYHIENALRAKALFILNDQYIVRNGEVLIVDEFTGRVLDGRRYSEGLHQAIEAKEGVQIQQESKTYATITFQNLFRMYKILCGGSGTVLTEGEEFFKIYGLETVVIPTNKPNVRKDHGDRIYKSQEAKFNAVAEEIAEKHAKGQPVLVGTTSVEKSEYLSQLLDQKGIPHNVLNAKYHEQEAKIVADAGKKGAVTVATNMAGRGTDIVIGGGNRGDAAWQEIADLGGLHVIGTERHDARRIDNQLRGRTGRQGEPGSTRFYVSLDDQIMRVLGGDIIARLMSIVKVPDDMPIENKVISKQIEIAQKRVESMNFDSRKRVVDYDDVMNQHREIFYARRKNILLRSENAIGKFIEKGRVVDLNRKENEEKRSKYEERIQVAKEKTVGILRDTINDEVDKVISQMQNQLVEKDKLPQLVETLVPMPVISASLKRGESDTKAYLQELIDSKNFVELEGILNETFEFKLKDFDQDVYNLAKMISLEELDKNWVEHLEIMKDVRDGIGLQGYAQRDPLVEYKNQAFTIFESFIRKTDSQIAQKIFRMQKASNQQIQSRQVETVQTNADQIEDVLTGDRELISDDTVKTSSVIKDIERNRSRMQGSLRTNALEQRAAGQVTRAKSFGRNDKVTVKYKDGRIEKGVKFKKVESDIESGNAEIVNG